MGENGEYKMMAEKEFKDKLDEDVGEFIVITKMEPNLDGAMEIETTEALITQCIEPSVHINNDCVGMPTSHVEFDDNLNVTEEITDDFYNDTAISVMLDDTKMKEDWSHEEYSLCQDEDDNKNIETIGMTENVENFDENSDEETIATFITSTGQQLALYAVEDSDEVFAVAVYSESGEPPTNFQFLMKADVERLIGEGAVRTVKKPQQMKKQTYQGELMTSRDKEMYNKSIKNSSRSPQRTYKNNKHQIQERSINECFTRSENMLFEEKIIKLQVDTVDEGGVEEEEEEEEEEYHQEEEDNTGINDDLTYQDILDNSYFLLDQSTIESVVEPKYINDDSNQMQDQTIVSDIDEEITEQSTVQYLLDGEDQSDSELTFDEIEKSLQYFDQNKRAKGLMKKSPAVNISSPEKINFNGLISSPLYEEIRNIQTPVKLTSERPVRRILQTSSAVKHKHAPNALLGRKSSSMESKQTVFIQGSTALICCPISEMEASMETSCKSSTESSFKIKRPRKQQLTIVNRADSEIIIQPASMVSEEEEEHVTKKRGRRKKRRQDNFKITMKTRSNFSRRISNERQSRIEVIDIDVEDVEDDDDEEEEDEYERRRNNIEEIITIEDGKEKGSSDKENEVIMVGDSDDDEHDDDDDDDDNDEGNDKNKREEAGTAGEVQKNIITPILKCDHCNRNFRQKRALDTHSRICPKLPNSRRRLTPSSRRTSSRSNDKNRTVLKKQYVCKICQEKFDVVVALARHVRSHYKKKETIASVAGAMQLKRKSEVSDKNIIASSTPIVQDTKAKRQLIIEQKNKERLNNFHRGWKSKKMSCTDCGRWFASAALLSAHCLQHATKKSEKRIKRCRICRKLFRSRLIYIRHMRMHSNAKQLQKRIKRTRQSTSTITTLRKRGRPRKL